MKDHNNMRDHNYLATLIRNYDDVVSLNEDILLKKTVTIKKDNLIIDGNGHTIDGNGKNCIFHIKAKNVVLRNMVLKNAKAPEGMFAEPKGYGGAIKNEGQLEINACEFINNVAEKDGYDILNKGVLKIECCKFSKSRDNKYSIFNVGSIKAFENEKNDLEQFISNTNVEWISKDPIIPVPDPGGIDITPESTIEEVVSALATASKPMNDNNQGYILHQPFDAYEGDEPFVFISYKHVDYKAVYPVIDKLQKAGINIWYDAGLPVGKNYDIQIAKHIIKSTLFVTFITEEAIRCANNQKDYLVKELAVAVHLNKKCLPIYLDNVDLDGYYLMHYLGIQSIFKFDYNDNDDEFIEDCISAFRDFGIKPNNE